MARRTGTPGRRLRTRAGNLLLAFALAAGTVAYAGLIVGGIVTDPDVAAEAAEAALTDEAVQSLLVDETADALARQLIGAEAMGSMRAFGYDPTDDLDHIAAAVVSDPQFAASFAATVRDLHEHVFVERGPVATIDASALVRSARGAAIDRNPAYAALFPSSGTLHVAVPTRDLPDLTGTTSAITAHSRLAAAVAVVLAGASSIVHGARPQLVRRVGCWALATAAAQTIVALVLVPGAGRIPGDMSPVAVAVAATLRPRLLAPAGLLAAAGVGLVLAAWRWQRSVDSRLERLGADAFLDGDGTGSRSAPPAPIATATLRSPMGAPPVPRAAPRLRSELSFADGAGPTMRRGG